MIAIERIASYIPQNFESNFDKLGKFSVDRDFICDKIGVERVSRLDSRLQASDMCVEAFAALQAECRLPVEDIDCIVVCTQNPDLNGLPHTSAIVHGKLGGREDCACFDIGLGCSGYVYSLSVVKSFMEANGLKRGILFTSDPYSKIVDPEDKNTVLIFGDAATATLLTEGGAWRPTGFCFGTRGKQWDGLYKDNGKLVMNGRAVFNFSATVVPTQITRLLSEAGVSADSVDLFLLHQGSKYIVDTIVSRLGIPPEKAPTNLAGQGNTVSSSIPLLMKEAIGQLSYRRLLISGFGVGLSWASALVERVQLPTVGELDEPNVDQ